MAKYGREKRKAVLATYLKGYSARDTAALHDMSESTVSKWVREEGLSRGMTEVRQAKHDLEFGLIGGNWVLNHRRVQVWRPSDVA